MILRIKKSQAFLGRAKGDRKFIPNIYGRYFLAVEVQAVSNTLYIPISIGSGRKSTGFIYVIEGDTESKSTASVDYEGKGASIITSGSISYCKIPSGRMALFKVRANVYGTPGQKYKFSLSRINYKINPNDLRYKKFLTDLSTESIRLK